jgi:CheY-like chemotaxis protein
MDQLFQRLLGDDIHLNFSTDPDLDPIKADPGQIGQVLMNLVVNARDAMAGGGRLTIETSHADLDEEFARTHLDAAPGSYVLLAVSDNGCGMDAETRTRIFEPFFTTKAQGEGTGLGLSTVYGIVAQSRGYVSVYSEPGIGTTFKVYLPRVKEPLSVAAVRPAAIAATSGTVLVADDEPAICELVGKVLGAHGYTVLIAADSTRAIAAAREHSTPVDLLITDVIMPGMNGPELAAAIGAHHAGMRVLYLSGYTDRAIVNNDVIPPNVTFLQKPFTPAVLLEKVQQVLGTDRPSP